MLFNKKRQQRRYDITFQNIPEKANRVLNIILIALFVIVIRIWHLGVIQNEEKSEEARKPRARIVIEPAKRATIRDRFNIPLATNKIRYNAAILYSQLREIPSVVWEKNSQGKKVKKQKRREYISKLSKLLAKELQLDSDRIEDLIHSKASFFYQIPFIIKEDLTESEYYRLKMIEKDWLGIQVQRVPQRHYPMHKVGGDIIGFMGSINKSQYESIINEMKSLEKLLKDESLIAEEDLPAGIHTITEARTRLKDLQEKAYTINDYVGKSGIEGMFEEELRGFQGRRVYYSDARGNYLRELPNSRDPLSGHRLLLTISSELQEFAEQLLIQNEKIREVRVSTEYGKPANLKKHPWIKGGAIVAMDPITGEILALASHPRFDPNDFISASKEEINKQKKKNISRWFESENYLADVWDQKRTLERELFDEKSKSFYDEERELTWDEYLKMILPDESPVYEAMVKMDLKEAVTLQQKVNRFLELVGWENPYPIMNALYGKSEDHKKYKEASFNDQKAIQNSFTEYSEEVTELKRDVDPLFNSLKNNYDKVLLLDLCRIACDETRFSTALLEKVGSQTIEDYRQATTAFIALEGTMRKMAKELFHQTDFKEWRKEHEKEFLKQKRADEKASKTYAKPYIDYIDKHENEMFHDFWNDNSWHFLVAHLNGIQNSQESLQPYFKLFQKWQKILKEEEKERYSPLAISITGLSSEQLLEYLKTMRGFKDLNRPLLGKYRGLRKIEGQQLEKSLASAFYPIYGFGYARSHAFRQSTTQGSIFKLVTAYAALAQKYPSLDPLEMVDNVHRVGKTWYVGTDSQGKAIPQQYKGGRIPRTRFGVTNAGKLDVTKALEVSSNSYFSLLAGDVIKEPLDLAAAAKQLSYGAKTGIDLPGEIAGRVPDDLEENRTGLYSFAIGQHSFVATPLQTAVMLSTFANGGKVLKPKIVYLTAGRERHNEKNYIDLKQNFKYKESLASAGLDFPLFTMVEAREQESLVKRFETQVQREIFLPNEVRHLLMNAMRRVVVKLANDGMSGLNRLYHHYPDYLKALTQLQNDFVGKTSTSESVENLNMDSIEGTKMCTHVWFSAVYFDKDHDGTTFMFQDEFGKPELVVVVYLRYGAFGKEAAPLAAQMIKKWREIKLSHAR